MQCSPLHAEQPPGGQCTSWAPEGLQLLQVCRWPSVRGGGGGGPGSALVRVDINTKLIQHSGVCPLPALQENPASVLDDLA